MCNIYFISNIHYLNEVISTSSHQPVLLSHKMNPQIQQALSKFSALLESRNSFLSEIDSKEPLDNAGG